jgi:hypothetical protein
LPANLTEALRQKLTEQITQNKISGFDSTGNLLSQRELEEYPGLQQAVWEITQNAGQLFTPDPIDESQIKISPDNSHAAIQLYFTQLLACFPPKDLKNNVSQPEPEMFLKAVENNDFSELELQQERYRSVYEKFKKLKVPSDFLSLHKELLDTFSSIVKIYEGIKNISEDPLKTNLALMKYQLLTDNFINWTQKLFNLTKNYSQ